MTKKEVLKGIDVLCASIGKSIGDFIKAATYGDGKEVDNQLKEMSRLLIGANQELSFLRDYIDENIKEDVG